MSTSTRAFTDRVWTPAEIGEAIGDDEFWRRYEIVDGVLIVSPPPAPRHDLVASELIAALRPAVPTGYVATLGTGMDLGRSYRITDATVVTRAHAHRLSGLALPSDILVAIEIESPSSVTTDRITKPAQYAAAGIAHYWRVEVDPLRLTVYRLAGDVYVSVGSWGVEETAVITDPFDVTIDMSTLLP